MNIKIIILFVAASVFFMLFADLVSWQEQAAPGKLSKAHASLANNCAACHTGVKGIEDAKCISCHADSKALLERQPTAFHAYVGNCSSCHIEHQGADANLRVMNHEVLAQMGLDIISGGKDIPVLSKNALIPPDHPHVSDLVSRLDCASCHGTKDKHVGLLGQNCASCHATNKWTITEFQHPSVRSITCVQCHQAPPSHYMMHFEMIDKQIAARDNTQGNGCCAGVIVSQCYSCHKTTAWNDIQGVGYYKHH